MTIEKGKLRFNTACLKKFEDVEYVELLLNTVTNTIAIRPCDADNPNAIRWGRLREERWVVSWVGCRGLSRTLFDLMNWEDEGKYRFRGQYISNGEEKLLVFELEEARIIKEVEQVITAEGEEVVIKEKVCERTGDWFVRPAVFIQQHYAGDWDVLRPATELEEMNVFTAAKMRALMLEAETIMEGWKKAE